jgi:hypothetical protein
VSRSKIPCLVRCAKDGRTKDAYKAYSALFSDASFARQRSQDQRQVLKLMVLAKSTPAPNDEVTSAYQSALARLKALATETDDPLDHEMIAVCEQRLNGNAERAGS